jgi:hypothetical protein
MKKDMNKWIRLISALKNYSYFFSRNQKQNSKGLQTYSWGLAPPPPRTIHNHHSDDGDGGGEERVK